MTDKKQRKSNWVTDYFTAALDNLERLQAVLDLSIQGINTIPALPRMMEVLHKPKESIAAAKQRATLAQQEIDRGFATLAGFGAVALWGWLETFVVDFVVLTIHRHPGAIRSLKAPKVKLDIAEYAQMTGRERAQFVTEAIDRELCGPLRNGIGRFDALLNAIGFSVPLKDDWRRNLLELQQVRNCLSHRFGVVDRRLASACPWLKLKAGKPLLLSRADLHRYHNACVQYLLLLLFETGDAIGVDYRSAAESGRDAAKNSE